LSNIISKLINKSSGQGSALILDFTRQAGATMDVVKRGILRYFGAGASKDYIRAVGKDFDIVLTREE